MKKLILPLLLIGFALSAKSSELEKLWQSPPADAHPWTYWYWMYGAFSEESITADLEAMKKNGIGGTMLFTIKGVPKKPLIEPSYHALTPEWWGMIKYAIIEADRVGLDIGFHACDGWALAGGPWITPEKSMQLLTWSSINVSGGGNVTAKLPLPPHSENYYRDIATFAYPTPRGEGVSTEKIKPKITTDKGEDVSYLVKDRNKKLFESLEPGWIQCEFAEPFTCRTLQITTHPRRNRYQAQRLKIMASDDGINFRDVAQLEVPRMGWYRGVPACTHSIPETTAKYFRFYYDPEGSEPASEDMDIAKSPHKLNMLGLRMSAEARLHQYEAKNGSAWRLDRHTTPQQVSDADCVAPSAIMDISQYVDAEGNLNWNAPAGEWTVLRMGNTTNGKKNGPAGKASGLECDKFSPEAAALQFDSWFGMAKRIVGPEVFSRRVKIFHVDSWECGGQNWSPVFRDEFRKRRGYDIYPYLPVMAGIPVGTVGESERVLYDVRQTITELITDNFFGTMQAKAHENGCRFSAECVAPITMSDGMMHYKNVDLPMGEFWFRSPTQDKPNDILDAVSGARIYGKNIVQAEAFTETRLLWDEHPGNLKTLQDLEYALGINRLVYHVNVHNPFKDKFPGMTLDGYGLYFQPGQTWYELGRAWVDYAVRCQALLQFGSPVEDIAVYTGEALPRRAVLPEKLVPHLPGIFGAARVESERTRLANKGTPVVEDPPKVMRTANMADPLDWANPLKGYNYSSFNPDALLNLARAENGRIVLPSGMSFAALIVPGQHNLNLDAEYMSVETARKINELAEQGVPVLMGKPANKSLGMREKGKAPAWPASGKFTSLPYRQSDFRSIGIAPDFIVTEKSGDYAGGISFIHRQGAGAHVYFVANKENYSRDVEVSVRVAGLKPELWDAVSGQINKNTKWKIREGRTIMPLKLAAQESVFIVLAEPATTASGSGTNWLRAGDSIEIAGQWKVSFDSAKYRGPKDEVTFDSLTDWSLHADGNIRHYSGNAFYRNKFNINKLSKNRRYFIELDEVYNMARIKINGTDCGIVWTPPYRVDVSAAVKKGANEIEIEVVNTWANRIEGDRLLPDDSPGKSWTLAPYMREGMGLEKSGLVGKVRLMTSE